MTAKIKLNAASGGGSISINAPSSAGSDTDFLDTSGNLAVSGTTTCTGNVTCSNDLSVDNDLKADSGFGSTTTIYGVRAWANFDGSGTVSSGNGGNVSSLVDLGEGTYRVNFSTAMPDTNYCMIAGSSNGATSVRTNCQQTKTTALYEFKTNDHGANTYDAQYGQIAFIR
jgi:hypothetical protein